MARASDPVLARQAAAGIVQRLRAAGHVAYFAGGCVRDELLGLRPTDFDVATDASPPRVRDLFARTAEVGAAFGVVLVHEGPGLAVEVATFRSDGPYTDARRPDSVRFSSPEEDARRRDFTINALFLDPALAPGAPGRIIDFVGGQADLSARIVRAVGDPDARLAEDHLRALRAVRFAARLNFEIEPRTAAAITRHASELRGVSRERIGDEVRRMLAHESRADVIRLIEHLGLDGPVLNEPPRGPSGGGSAMVALLPARPLQLGTVLSAWCIKRMDVADSGLFAPKIRDIRSKWRAALCLSNDEATEFSDVLEIHAGLVQKWEGMGVAQRKRLGARAMFAETLVLLEAGSSELAERITRDIKELESDGIGIRPAPLVTGEDLIAIGLLPGPQFKRILEQVTDAQLEGRVRDKAQAMELALSLSV